MLKFSIIVIFLLNILSFNLFAQSPCTNPQKNTVLASASTWDNLRNSENSIKFKIGKLLKEGIGSSNNTEFTIESKPNKLITEYSDKAYCDTKRLQTGVNQLAFDSPDLKSIDDLNSWIADFSQGKGKAGEELYEKCDKTCSPAYTYQITYNNQQVEKFTVQAKVICGHARDKDDNQYSLTLKKCAN